MGNPPERIFSRPNRLRGREPRLDGFSSMALKRQLLYSARNTLFPVEFSSIQACFTSSGAGFHAHAIQNRVQVRPYRSLQLCWISAVGRTEFTTFVQTLDLFSGDRLLVNHASYLSRLSEVFHEVIKNLVGFCKSGVTDD